MISGTWLEPERKHRIMTAEDYARELRIAAPGFPRVGILKRPRKKRKKKETW